MSFCLWQKMVKNAHQKFPEASVMFSNGVQSKLFVEHIHGTSLFDYISSSTILNKKWTFSTLVVKLGSDLYNTMAASVCTSLLILIWHSLCDHFEMYFPFLCCVSEEAALVLGRDAVLLARVMEWCEAKDHAGVRGEASRLLAALIRHSRSPVSPFTLS